MTDMVTMTPLLTALLARAASGTLILTLLVGGATGVLLGTAAAKAWAAARARLAWPQGANFLHLHLSLGLVVAVEVLASAVALSLPSLRLACLVLAAVYAAFVVGATTLRGQECGCFGVEGMTVGPLHIWGCALTSAALGLVAFLGDGLTAARPARLAAAVATALVMTLALQLLRGREAASARASQEHHDRLLVVLSPTCPACSALKIMENHDVSDTEAAGTVTWVDQDSQPAAALRQAGVDISSYPAVVSLDSTNPARAQVRSGLQECREVLQSWRQRHLVAQV
ncbi:hypothetical protein [Actinomyces wuliandei]|uniref:hypothetical protein n=1 Tax=Actinomyces wuliandei TaxID=2057743 RepID=UPI00214B7BB6|nr:hypothetical protein [Actinomyces wuliandei]